MLFERALSVTVIKATAVISASMALVACGGGTSTSAPAAPPQNPLPTTLTGTFIDSPVANIGYRTDSIASDTTDSQGQFSYLAGESVTFSIGDVDLPPVAAESVITPLDIIDTQDINDPSVVNMARLLQSLDADGDPTNGISIDDTAHLSATGIMSLDFSSPTFDAEVMNLVANGGQETPTTLIDESTALSHLQDSLDSAGLLPTPQVGSWYEASGNRSVITFLDGANYFVTQDVDNIGEPLCSDGMESGTYTWDSVNGDFSLANVIDTTGDCGLTSAQGEAYNATITISENTLTLTDFEGSFPLSKVVDINSPIVGSWYEASGNRSVITFLDGANYFVTQDVDNIGEPLCSDGMESGTYIWNSVNGDFSVANVIDTTGDCGLTSVQGEAYNATITVSGNTLTLTDAEGSFPLTRVQ